MLHHVTQTLVWCCQALRQRAVCLRISLLCRQVSATAPASPLLSLDRPRTRPIRCQVSEQKKWQKGLLRITELKRLNVPCVRRFQFHSFLRPLRHQQHSVQPRQLHCHTAGTSLAEHSVSFTQHSFSEPLNDSNMQQGLCSKSFSPSTWWIVQC